jgi:hypothetical protein
LVYGKVSGLEFGAKSNPTATILPIKVSISIVNISDVQIRKASFSSRPRE